jgi:hypothetical protein
MMNFVLTRPAAKPAPAEPSASPRSVPRVRRLDLSDDAYWLLAIVIVAAYLVLWVTHFEYVYGWITDDRSVFAKGMDTVREWKAAFSYFNALQPYFFLISYLPLHSGLSLPSVTLPWSGPVTGQFRFLLLCAVYFHAVLLLLWAWLAAQIARNKLAALLSLLLFATSPTLMLWSPEPESRLFGLPFCLLGLWLLLGLRLDGRQGAWRVAVMAWLAGSLFGLAQAIHYTALYLIAPLSVVYWGVALWRGWRTRNYWLGLLAFAVGSVWLQGLMEYLSYFVVGLPFEKGPTMTLMNLRDIHRSHFTVLGDLGHWVEWFRNQLGWPLVAASLVGAVFYWRTGAASTGQGRLERAILPLTVLLGLIYVWLSGTMPFFRQTSVLQPFLFLFAGIGVVSLAGRGPRWLTARFVVALALFGLAAVLPWVQAQAVLQGHQGLGRTLRWAATQNRGAHPLEWLRIAWYDDNNVGLTSLEDLEQTPPDTWLVTYFPFQFMTDHPSLLPAFQHTQPLVAWPTLWATDAVHTELAAYWVNADWRYHRVMSEARLYRVGDLLEQMRGEPLRVDAVTADSTGAPSFEPVNVFDRDQSPDGATGWVSANTPMPHWLEAHFEAAVPLSEVDVVLAPTERSTSPIGSLEVQLADEQGTYQTVWVGRGLERYPAIAARWPQRTATAIRLVIHEQVGINGPSNQAAIEEVVFPGYEVVAPRPQRSFPNLTLTEVRPSGKGFAVVGSNVTAQTALVLDGVRLPHRPPNGPGRFFAPLPRQRGLPSGQVQAYLTDGFRQSNVITVNVGPPGLQVTDGTVIR